MEYMEGVMALKELYAKYFMKQKMMHPVIFALAPLALVATYFYGWRVLVLLLTNILVATLVEYISNKKIFKKAKISEAVIVTSCLYTMTLPASIPLWISFIGIAFGIFFGKMVFGGFGKNVFNPALVGRVFIYVNFPQYMTIYWNEALKGFPAGFGTYLTRGLDSLSEATPMAMFKMDGALESVQTMLLGNIPGVIGETCKVLIIIGAIYLIIKKVASWEIMASSVLGFVVLSVILRAMGVTSVPDPINGMLMGGFLFGTVFMATDPISAAKTTLGKWIYGSIIGIVTVIIRGFALFAGGVMFAILIGNTFAPIIDYAINAAKASRKEARAND